MLWICICIDLVGDDMTVEKNEIIPRILRDMNDGVLVVDMHGKMLLDLRGVRSAIQDIGVGVPL